MTPELHASIMAHIQAEAPREACGVLVWNGKDGATYHPCRNIAGDESHFCIHPEDWVAAGDAGKILGVVHSHPGGTVEPSEADRRGRDRSGVPWWVFTLDGAWKRTTPCGWSVFGHPFAWGVQDCFTVARDLIPGLPDFVRRPMFWEGEDLFMDSLSTAGMAVADGDPGPGDGLLMSIRGHGRANHCAVYLAGGKIAHHLPGRLSIEEDLGPLRAAVVAVVRRAR